MKNLPHFLVAVVLVACGVNAKSLFSPAKPAHTKYEDKIEDSPEGRAWKAAAEKSLEQAQGISLPFRMQGYFPGDRSRALAFRFAVKRGQRIQVRVEKDSGAHLTLFSDLFVMEGNETDHLISIEKESPVLEYNADDNGTYILRIQPELNNSGEYSLSITTGPSLGFPVSGKARTGSFWGDSRDGGKRSHEGIDIFAPKHAPAVAAADGYISSVKDGGLGGKTVNLRPTGRNISLYYAHLDKQLVEEGQYVKKGDVIGLVGNTGNAKHTPPHLHFGIYAYGGAIDPFPFVDPASPKLPVVPDRELNTRIQLTKKQSIDNGTSLEAKTVLQPLAITDKGYIAESPDGSLVQAKFSSVSPVK